MKKLYIILMSILGVSCSDFLEVDPVSQESTNNFYSNPADFEIAINATYGVLQPIYANHMFRLGELRSDNTFLQGDPGGNRQAFANIDYFEVETTNGLLLDFWNTSYKGIANANTVIDRIGLIEFEDPELKSRILGEAYFLRALFHFNLSQVFGKVPVILEEITDPEQSNTHFRQTLEVVYAQIESDLLEAANLLPASYAAGNAGRATTWAAKGLLGKVYLTQRKYSEAQLILLEVVNSDLFALEANYESIFDPSNKNGVESLFEIQFDGSVIGEGSPFVNQFAPRFSTTLVPSGIGEGNNQPTEDMVNAYETGDQRLEASLKTSFTDANGNLIESNYITKFFNGTSIPNQGIDNFPVLRYADILLMLTEAQFFQNGSGIAFLNQVRNRAGLENLTGIDLDAILQERRVELAFENYRWFDLVRTGMALAVMNDYLPTVGIGATSIQEFQLMYPIPQAQIDANPDVLDQNPGYQ